MLIGVSSGVAGGAAAGTSEHRDEWRPYRQGLYDSYVAGFATRAAQAQQAAEQTRKDVESAAQCFKCASCQRESLRVERRVTVICVSWQHAVRVDVPVYVCTECTRSAHGVQCVVRRAAG